MSTWAEAYADIRTALETVAGLVELPAATAEAAGLTLTQPGRIGFSVVFQGTAWTNDRQRQKHRVEHTVEVALLAMTKQLGRESETLTAMLDVEQAALAALLERSATPQANLSYIGTLREFTAGRDFLITRMAFTLAQTVPTGANL